MDYRMLSLSIKGSSTRPRMEPMLSTNFHKHDFLKSCQRMSSQCSYERVQSSVGLMKDPVFPNFHHCNKFPEYEIL
jgi:hypothetical protein